MKSKIFKRLFLGLAIILVVGCLLMIVPRVLSSFQPDKPPVGYYFEPLDFLAIKIGLEDVINRTPAIPADIEALKNIEYKNINGKSLQLDIYRPYNILKPAPMLVFIHGGGWKGGSRADYLVYLLSFAKKGYITATVSYRLLKDAPYPACAEDITDAVKWVMANGEKYGYDPKRVALIGGSAGGHLALLAAYQWKSKNAANDSAGLAEELPRIKAVVDIYGPVDLTTNYARNHPLVTNFLGHSFSESPELFSEASPISYTDKNDPATLILHGTSDNLVPLSESISLKARLDSLGVPCVYRPVPGWPHAMDVDQRVNDYCQKEMSLFLEKYLK